MNKEDPLVSICCITYNHENYIRDAIEGFLIQETSFPIEIIIHDDASTDRTAQIIQEYEDKYPDLFVTVLQTENQWSKGGGSIYARFVFPLARGKYIALCEGDDYWTDPLKLQKQVDFLGDNPECGLVYTKCTRSDTQKTIGGNLKINEIFYKNKIPALTCVFDKNIALNYLEICIKDQVKWAMGDYPLWLWFEINSHIGFIDKVTAVYRVLPESASHSTDGNKRVIFNISSYEVASYFGRFHLSNIEYYTLLNKRLFFLMLSCLKHKSPILEDVILKIKELNKKTWYNRFVLLLAHITKKI
jgi:glycosyltransferase involved in cell wall biosynthesis